jgi:hypothetical protein
MENLPMIISIVLVLMVLLSAAAILWKYSHLGKEKN